MSGDVVVAREAECWCGLDDLRAAIDGYSDDDSAVAIRIVLVTVAGNVALDRRLATVDRRLVLETLSVAAGTDLTWMRFADPEIVGNYVADLMEVG